MYCSEKNLLRYLAVSHKLPTMSVRELHVFLPFYNHSDDLKVFIIVHAISCAGFQAFLSS